jgi:hypothetical protein
MKIYLTDQYNKLDKHLELQKSKKVKIYDKSSLPEKISTIEMNTAKRLDQLNLDFLFNYEVFPGNILTFKTQWQVENRKMKIGDTIVQQVFIPPVKTFSQKIIFGVRINEIFDLPHRKGFSYETLEGHAEKGLSIFTVEEIEGRLIFKIHTYSEPGNFFSRLVGPVFTLPYQAFCIRAALRNVKRQVEGQ